MRSRRALVALIPLLILICGCALATSPAAASPFDLAAGHADLRPWFELAAMIGAALGVIVYSQSNDPIAIGYLGGAAAGAMAGIVVTFIVILVAAVAMT